jgi:hypothetical protein
MEIPCSLSVTPSFSEPKAPMSPIWYRSGRLQNKCP